MNVEIGNEAAPFPFLKSKFLFSVEASFFFTFPALPAGVANLHPPSLSVVLTLSTLYFLGIHIYCEERM
jgi:hypothetical protein